MSTALDTEVLVFGSTGYDIFAVSKHFKGQSNGPEQTIVFDHPSQIWLDNSISEPGGAALLAAITLSRQDINTNLLSVVGADGLGKALHSTVVEEHISDSLLNQTSAHNTDMHIHITSSGSDQTVFHYTGAFLSINKTDVNKIDQPFSWLHIADIPTDKKVLQALLKMAANYGAKVSINPRFVHTYHTGWLIKVLQSCEWVFLNRDEASLLLGGYFSLAEAAEKLQLAGIKNGVVYDDTDGSCTFTGGASYVAELYGQSKTLEPSGAEAVFCAAFVSSIIAQESIETVITHASAQASSVRSVVGSRAAILQRPALRKLNIKQDKGGQI
jgi:sugar/nucleoside kinase (ribokinase family)